MNKNWFTRTEQDVVDEKYLHNMLCASHYFANWFEKPDESYKDMLYHMHAIVADGYNGYTNSSNYIIKPSLGFRGSTNHTWYPVLRKKWFPLLMSNETMLFPKLYNSGMTHHHYLDNTEEGYVLHLTPPDNIQEHLVCMARQMENLRTRVSMHKLAEYIHLFVVTHPFEKINYSICMAQVNHILAVSGRQPILHGYFDFECFVYDWDVVYKIFLKMIGEPRK